LQTAKSGNDQSKRQRVPKHAQLEQALSLWFWQQEARDLSMADRMLREQARQIAPRFDVPNGFCYSNGWLANLKKRQGIKQVVLHGEAAIQMTLAWSWHARLFQRLLKKMATPQITFIIRTRWVVREAGSTGVPSYRHAGGTEEEQAVTRARS
jgi:hypothetical protein